MAGVGRKDGGESGGWRPGAGRKRGTSSIGRVLTYPSAPVPSEPCPEIDESQAPNELTPDERLVWMEMGKLALSHGRTVAEIQAYPFQLLCKNVVLERRYSRSVNDAGSTNHRGMIQVVEREMVRFGLIEIGKPAKEKPKTINPFAQVAG